MPDLSRDMRCLSRSFKDEQVSECHVAVETELLSTDWEGFSYASGIILLSMTVFTSAVWMVVCNVWAGNICSVDQVTSRWICDPHKNIAVRIQYAYSSSMSFQPDGPNVVDVSGTRSCQECPLKEFSSVVITMNRNFLTRTYDVSRKADASFEQHRIRDQTSCMTE